MFVPLLCIGAWCSPEDTRLSVTLTESEGPNMFALLFTTLLR